jgi:hypothetical protein
LVETREGQKLLARREPGQQKSTADMCLLEEKAVSIPLTLPTRNTTVDAVKRNLDQLAGLSALQFDSESDSGFKGRPSFRDLTSFLFQPRDSLRPGPGWLRFFKIGNRGLQPTPDAPKRVPAHRICALPLTFFRPVGCCLTEQANRKPGEPARAHDPQRRKPAPSADRKDRRSATNRITLMIE